MPLLDMSDVLDDIDFLDSLSVTRITQTVTEGGMAVNTPKTWPFFGVVTSKGGKRLKRKAEGEVMVQSIYVVTRMTLQDGRQNADGSQNTADILTWAGNTYTVVVADNYSRYGRGFIQATCDLIQITG